MRIIIKTAVHIFLEEQGYINNINKERLHHEIYLSDTRKINPEKWKTVIRHPIKKKKLNFLEKGGSVIRLCGFVYIPHVGLPDAFI